MGLPGAGGRPIQLAHRGRTDLEVDWSGDGNLLPHQLPGDGHEPHRATVRHAALGPRRGRAGWILSEKKTRRPGWPVGAGVRRPGVPRQAGEVHRGLCRPLRWQAVAALRGHRQCRRLGRGPHLVRQRPEIRLRLVESARGSSPQTLSQDPARDLRRFRLGDRRSAGTRTDARLPLGQRRQLSRRQHPRRLVAVGAQPDLQREQPGVFPGRRGEDPDRSRTRALRHGQGEGQLDRPPRLNARKDSEADGPEPTFSAARSNSSAPPISVTTATPANGWPTTRRSPSNC